MVIISPASPYHWGWFFCGFLSALARFCPQFLSNDSRPILGTIHPSHSSNREESRGGIFLLIKGKISMKKWMIVLFGVVMIFCFASEVSSVSAASTGWVLKDGNWYYYNQTTAKKETGWVFDRGSWYYLDSSGVMKTGWVSDAGKWYYLSKSGAMKTGWVLDAGKWYYLGSNGVMKTGWVSDAGKWYYLNQDGSMKMGWLLDAGNWYYLNNSGAMRTGWLELPEATYYFTSNGAMVTGWKTIDGWNSYFEQSGVQAIGWKLIDGNWYYFDEYRGIMVASSFVNGYYLNSDGIWAQVGSDTIVSTVAGLKNQLDVGLTQDELVQLLGPNYSEKTGVEGETLWLYSLAVTGDNEYSVVEWDAEDYYIEDIARGKASLYVIVYWDQDKKAYSVNIEYFDAQHKFHTYTSYKRDYQYN
jgi:glucan-binding repeat-containing protein